MIDATGFNGEDIYAIDRTAEGEKLITFLGWFYKRDDESIELVEPTSRTMPLKEFLADYVGDKDKFAAFLAKRTQYVTKFEHPEDAQVALESFYNKKAPAPLPFSELTNLTPTGCYINLSDADMVRYLMANFEEKFKEAQDARYKITCYLEEHYSINRYEEPIEDDLDWCFGVDTDVVAKIIGKNTTGK